LAILTQSWRDHRKRYEAHSKAAEDFLSVGESPRNPNLNPIDHAAFTVLANLIMNLDEAVTRE
jgi:hypothetical protein